jgi:hypothetical protein
MAAAASSNTEDFTVQVNDSEVKRDDVIEVLKKTGLYGTVQKK